MRDDPMSPIFHFLVLAVYVGSNTNFRISVGSAGFLDANMVVSQMQNSCIGGIAKHEPQREGFCVAVEYRLNSMSSSRQQKMYWWPSHSSRPMTTDPGCCGNWRQFSSFDAVLLNVLRQTHTLHFI